MTEMGGNYVKKVIALGKKLGRSGLIGFHEVDVYHDSWCDIHKGKPCNCDPDVILRTNN